MSQLDTILSALGDADVDSYWIRLWNESRRGASGWHDDGSRSLIPPQWFVDQWNERGLLGAPYATALDAVVMHAWHLTTPKLDPRDLVKITGV